MSVGLDSAMIRIPPARDRANNELRRSALLGLVIGEQEGRGLLGNDWWKGGEHTGRAAGAEECEFGGPSRAGVLDAAATGGYVAAMRSVGLKRFNDNPSEYVWLAAAGETVLVTDHDRVVAEIVPPRVERNPVPDDPRLTPPTAPGSGPPPAPPPIMSLDQLLRELGEDRRDR